MFSKISELSCHYISILYIFQVIPLSQKSGLLEWCEGTVPIGEYLINPKTGAHQRYRPGDITAHQCRKYMTVSTGVLLTLLVSTNKHHFISLF